MRRVRVRNVMVTVGGLLFLVGVAVAAWPACACLPPVYEEVDPASIPQVVLQQALARAPGLAPTRAWVWGVGSRPHFLQLGYVLRGKRAGAWLSEDVKVKYLVPESGPVDLRPADDPTDE
jgi:hypothetical protein